MCICVGGVYRFCGRAVALSAELAEEDGETERRKGPHFYTCPAHSGDVSSCECTTNGPSDL